MSDFAYPVVVRELPDPPTVTAPIAPQSTEVTLTGIADAPFATAALVEVYVNGGFAGDAVPTGDTVAVTVPELASGDEVEARQIVNGAVSDFSVPVTVALPAPTIYYVPADGDEVVVVTSIDPTATEVTVVVDGTPNSTPYDPEIAPFGVPVSPPA